MSYEFPCPECLGEGEITCDCCGVPSTCDVCNGSCVDPEEIDLDKFAAAEHELMTKGDRCSWAIIENGVCMGRGNGSGKIFYRDFKTDP